MLDPTKENNIKILLSDIQSWIYQNDYECGEVGAVISARISAATHDYFGDVDGTTEKELKEIYGVDIAGNDI